MPPLLRHNTPRTRRPSRATLKVGDCSEPSERMTDPLNRRNEGAKERRSEGTKERRSEGTKERRNFENFNDFAANERMNPNERRNEGTKERRNEGTKERRNEGTKERRNEGTNEEKLILSHYCQYLGTSTQYNSTSISRNNQCTLSVSRPV